MAENLKTAFGTITVNNFVDISDPYYSPDIWCRINNIRMYPGEYACEIRISDEGDFGKRVSKIRIYHSETQFSEDAMKPIGKICVDSGTAGFFADSHELPENEKSDFWERSMHGHAWKTSNGFFSSSGYGDGSYPVYAAGDAGKGYTALEIRFI